MFRLIELLHGPKRNVKRVSRELGISTRTLYRDVDHLRDIGVPIFYNERCHCWYLGEAVQIPEWAQILKRVFTR